MSTPLADLPAVELPRRAAADGSLPAFLASAATTHGPIFRAVIPAGRDVGREVVFMLGPSANRFVMHTHREHFSHDQGWTPVLGAAVGQGLLNMDDPMHAHHRRLWNPAFTGACMEVYLPAMQRIIAERMQEWVEDGEINLYEGARWLTFDIAATVLAGFEAGAPLNRARELFCLTFHGYDRLRETRRAYQKRKRAAREELDQLLLGLITQRRRIPADAQPRDVLGMIVHASDEQGARLTDEQVLAHLNILLVAGHETTTTFTTWALYLLSILPEHRQRIREEVARAIGADDLPLSTTILQAMPWLDCFFREVGRLYSSVLHLPRGVLAPFTFEGYTIPAGTPVRLALAAGHRLPNVFADPERFDPGRFLPPREEDRRQPYAYVPFGAGSRICIGINFSQVELKSLIVHFLQHYELEPLPGQQPVHAGFWVARVPFGIRARIHRKMTR